jgi:hypothetical protein
MKLVSLFAVAAVALVAVSAAADDGSLRLRRSDLVRSDRSGSVAGETGVVTAPGIGDRAGQRDRFTPAMPDMGISLVGTVEPQRVDAGSEVRDVDEITMTTPVAGIEQLGYEGESQALRYQDAVDFISLTVEIKHN